jgi:Na+-exporting ATPase
LECDEALLTGESLPSVKTEDPIADPVCPVGDRTCMIYSGSQAAKGRAKVICVATGMDTELGKISAALSRKETNKRTGFAATWYKFKVFLGLADTTPLQIKLNKLAYIVLFFACIVAVIVVASTGFKDVPLSIATYAVAAAVSLLPASLPAVIALSLSTASKRLADSNALVRRMDAIETLAAVTDVCSDKTGTITLGKMVTRRVWVPAGIRGAGASADYSTDLTEGQYFTVETASDPFHPRGAVRTDSAGGDKSASAAKTMANHPTRSDDSNDSDEQTLGDGPVCDPNDVPEPLHELTLCAALCSSATIQRIRDEESKEEDLGWEGHGDATEVALQVYAHKLGYGKPHLTSGSSSSGSASPSAQDEDLVYSTRPDKYELLVEHAFDSSIKRMSMAYLCTPGPASTEKEPYVLVLMKGAFERVFDRCTSILADENKTRKIESGHNEAIQIHYERLASDGLRVLTMCSKRLPASDAATLKELARDDLETDMSFLGLAGIYDPPRVESALAVEDCHKASIIPRMLTGDHLGTAIAIAQQVGILQKVFTLVRYV